MAHIEAAAATDVGRVRAVNEDSFLVLPHVVVVADGMGGHACGDVASALAVAAFAELGDGPVTVDDVVEAVARADRAILDEAAAREERDGMGTTLTGVALVDQGGSPHWLVFNVGDSRVYRLAGAVATQLTVDHSEVADLVAAGHLTPEQARVHPLRHVITRSLGMGPEPVPDAWLVPVAADDLFLACSDGLTGEVQDEEIGRLVAEVRARGGDLDAVARALVDAAVEAGGHDNVTVVLAAPAGSLGGRVDDAERTAVIERAGFGELFDEGGSPR